ncbi:NACHT%2C LRR and PYD domains-containing protein 14-like, partial [Scomber scombrus]
MEDRQNSATPDEGSSVSSRQPSISAQTGGIVVAPPIINSTVAGDVIIHVNSPGQGSASSSHGTADISGALQPQ